MAVAVAAAMFAALPTVRAGDIDSAKNSLAKVKSDVDNSSWDSIEADIKATESFLDGLPDADKAPVQKDLDALKAKAAAGVKDYQTKRVLDSSKQDLDTAAESIATDPGGAKDMIDRANALLDSDEAKKYVDPDQVAKLHTRAVSLQTMVYTKYIDSAKPIVDELDAAMAAKPFKDAKSPEEVDQVSKDLGQLKSRINGALSSVPAADPRVVAIKAKIAGYDQVIAAAEGNAGAATEADNLARQWTAQKEYFAGWDAEKECPTWKDWNQKNDDKTGNLDMPKTVELLVRVGPWLDEDYVKKTAETYKDNASVKATMAEAHSFYDTAGTKLNANFNTLVASAEQIAKPSQSDQNAIEHLAQRVDYWFHVPAMHDANAARVKAVVDKWKNAAAGAAAADDAALAKATADATAAWPGIKAPIKAEDGLTADQMTKGKIVHITGDNRLGYDFQPGDYNYAREIHGMPVAGTFTPAVQKAFDAGAKLSGVNGVSDNHWEVFGEVVGPGMIQRRKQVSGDIKVDGEKVGEVTGEQNPSVPCVVIKIFALHIKDGPVAVGSATVNGAAVSGGAAAGTTPAGSSSDTAAKTSLLGHLTHVVELLLLVGAAGLVVLKGKPALAAKAVEGQTAVKLPGAAQVEMAGLAIIAIGLVWLVGKLIIGDLLPAGALVLCGVYLSTGWLAGKKILPASVVSMIAPMALPIAGAAVLFGVLHLFLASMYLF